MSIPKTLFVLLPRNPKGKQAAYMSKRQAIKAALRRKQITGKLPWIVKYKSIERV